jgi:hypothetical protein
MYFHINRQIDLDPAKIDKILQHATREGAILTIDSN